MNFVVDIGNSTIKVGAFEGTQLKDLQRFDREDELMNYLQGTNARMIVSSVKGPDAIPTDLFRSSPLILDHKTPLPIKYDYKTPETLGPDRIAAAVGAYQMNPDNTNLVIDVGSAINYELVSASGVYLGGAISPGLEMRYKSLNNYTAALPLISHQEAPEWIGKSTKECISSGVFNGVYLELEGLIKHYHEAFSDLVVTGCGGDIELFDSRLKATIFVVPNLVLLGLNGILKYNEERN